MSSSEVRQELIVDKTCRMHPQGNRDSGDDIEFEAQVLNIVTLSYAVESK